ncbi:MAG: hypothetical protein KDD02_07890 [Phaeodactylibacter sp.]|nr:hypothetical protein [Phaeodactylibacter sp.]
MPNHAGFAAAVTVREQTLKVAMLAAYANGSFPKMLVANLPGGPPTIATNLFLDQPEIHCEGSTNLLVLALGTWGSLNVVLDEGEHIVQIVGELEVAISPAFRPGSSLQLDPVGANVVVRRWTAAVISTDTPDNVVSIVVGEQFKARLQQAIQFAILIGAINLPSIDVSFFGPLADKATSVSSRVRDGALLLGLNYGSQGLTLVGNENALADFAFSNDVAGVVNPNATGLLLDELHTQLLTQVEQQDASLDRFSVNPAAGHFLVSGAVSKTGGTVNFSFKLVPSMFHVRPGKYFQYLPKPRWVKSRIWPALEFKIEDVTTDVDRSWWVILLDILGVILTAGIATLYIEGILSSAAQSFSGKIKAAKTGAPTARIQRTIPPTGGVGVRIGLERFDISTDETYIGISTQPASSPIILLGPKTVPSTYMGEALRYQVQLPSGVSEDDPALRIHWILEDRTNNLSLIDDDRLAAGQLRFDFLPSEHANTSDFGIVVRLYRRLGPNVTDLGTTSLNIHMRGPLPPAAYVRWRSEVRNPQIAIDEATETWTYQGEVRVRRWSKWHRTDAPCRAVNATNRFRFDLETACRLPFLLIFLEKNRKHLCPYCFYGGPDGVNPDL